MKSFYWIVLLCFIFNAAPAQDKFYTKNGKISFFSSSPMEDIRANNNSVTCVLDTKTGDIQSALLMKGFEFKKALMQEHFNEDYVESDKYPRAVFKGQVINNSSVDYKKDGVYKATVKGKLTMHGETRDVQADGKIEVKGGHIVVNSEFPILLSDYRISIPRIARNNVSNNVKVIVDCTLDPLKG